MNEQEFDCEDCGRRVHTFAEKPPTMCATCTWIRKATLSPAEEAEVRKRMKVEKVGKR